jgi:hypothetical protein
VDAGLDRGGGRRGVTSALRSCLLALLVAFTLGAWGGAQPARAWGPAGHIAIAQVAMANVRPQTAAQIQALLKVQGQLGTPACPVASLADAANWPDCLRGDPEHWRDTFAWHYQNEPVCGRFDAMAHCPGGNCVSAQIIRMHRKLADRHQPPAQRLAALAFLAHFIGDIHQPLHVADHDDRGGNDVIVANRSSAYSYSRPLSLHALWDTTLPERVLLDRAHPIVRSYTPAERAQIATGDVPDWARESYDIARQLAFRRAFHRDPCAGRTPQVVNLSEADIRAMLPTVRQRLVQAGLRLARALDQALAG